MDVTAFLRSVGPLVKDRPLHGLAGRLLRRLRLASQDDPCRDIVGMASPKKLHLLRKAVSFLSLTPSECYLEVGTYQGKSLVAALVDNPDRYAIACDNFSLFDEALAPKNKATLERNLQRYGLSSRVRFFDCDFRDLLPRWRTEGLPPVGVYFYDGAHDEVSQYLAIRLAEDVLADEAVVIIDDWRYAPDSQSFAEAGTRRALADSSHQWKVEHILPARYNGDLDQWWNGVAVLSFQRRTTRTLTASPRIH